MKRIILGILLIFVLVSVGWFMYCAIFHSKSYIAIKQKIQSNLFHRTKSIYLRKYYFEEDKERKELITKIITEGETEGYFSRIEFGDYEHFCVKDLEGKEESFFISEDVNDTLLAKFKLNNNLVGKKVKVIWNNVDMFIPEAGGNQVVKVMVDLKILK